MATTEQLVEKWEQSGLLEGALNKEGIARCLEDIAQVAMMNAATLNYKFVNEAKLAVAISLLFPAARLALGERNFALSEDKNFTREVFEVEYPTETPDEVGPEHCHAVAERVSKVLEEYKNLKVHGFLPDFTKGHQDKFELHVLLSEEKVG